MPHVPMKIEKLKQFAIYKEPAHRQGIIAAHRMRAPLSELKRKADKSRCRAIDITVEQLDYEIALYKSREYQHGIRILSH